MKLLKRIIQKSVKVAFDNYVISIFIIIILIVGIYSFIKLIDSDEEYVYAEVKISQGLWWASISRPPIWMVEAPKIGDTEVDGGGNIITRIEEVRYYPTFNSNLYDIYLLLRLETKYNNKTSKYTYKRSEIGLGSPITLEFPNLQVNGTVMKLSKQPIKQVLAEKEIVLSKKLVSSQEYNALKVGDSYFDGKETVFEVTDIALEDSYLVYSSEGNNYPIESENPKNVQVTARIKVNERNGLYIFGKEQILRTGKVIEISTPNFNFTDYRVVSIN